MASNSQWIINDGMGLPAAITIPQKSIYSFIATGTETEIDIKSLTGDYYVKGSIELYQNELRKRPKTVTTLGNNTWHYEEIKSDKNYDKILLNEGFNPNEPIDIYYLPTVSRTNP